MPKDVLVRMRDAIQGRISSWGDEIGALEKHYSPLIEADSLNKMDYFSSFPHSIVFPVSLKQEDANLEQFSKRPLGDNNELQLNHLQSSTCVLASAACFQVYIDMQNQRLESANLINVRNTCFRNEETEEPFVRQKAFTMQELVCVGSAEDASEHVRLLTERISDFFQEIDLPVSWEPATDSFYKPSRNPKYLIQKVHPVKYEMIYEGLAIGSTNLHSDSFGRALDITMDEQPASSSCVAFGIDRWVHALRSHHGETRALSLLRQE